jgi:hypothetical protein
MSTKSHWKPLAWNGIRLEVPADWDPARIGRRFLLLEDADGPALALRWEPIAGRFDPEKTLQNLSRAVGTDAQLRSEAPPPLWKKAVTSGKGPSPEVSGFRWQDGAGLLLYWSGIPIAALAGFYGDPPPAAGPVLAAIRPVFDRPTLPYFLYDLHARVPADLNLDRFRFVPGAFELAFSGGGTRLRLYRWGPASMLVGGDGLAAFARQRIPSVPANAAEDGGTLQWETGLGGPLGKLVPGNRPRFEAGRVWRLPGPDRLLGVVAAGPTKEAARTLRDRTAADCDIAEPTEAGG